MSSIDKRVVEMEFDNKEFQSGIETTQKSLGDLDNTINSLGKGSSGGYVTNALSGIGDAVAGVADNFSYLETFISGVFLRLGSMAADYAVQLTKSLTLDQVTEGWTKYEQVVKNTASIQNQAAYQGYNNDDAAEAINELMWFADATSYSSDAMMSALNAMLGGGVDLNDAVEVILGLANSFSYMGATATEMDGAFSMISKSMGEGAHMGAAVANSLTSVYHVLGEEIKTMFMDTASEMGILEKKGDGVYAYLKETSSGINEIEVSVGTFKDTLAEGWLNSDVLVETYSNSFGNYANNVYALADAWSNMDTDGSKITDTMREFAEANGIAEGSVLTASQAMEMYDNEVVKNGGEIDEYGRKVFAAAMEAKSFSEVLDALKDASSTQWSIIFQSIFGKYNDAKELFTELGDYLSSVFVGPIATVADAFEKWSVMAEGGRDTLIQAFKNIAAAIESIVKPVTNSFREIFGSISAESIQKAVIGIESFTSKLAISGDTASGLQTVFTSLLKIIKFNIKIFKEAARVVGGFLEAIRPIGSMIAIVAGNIAEMIGKIVDAADQLGIIENIADHLIKMFASMKASINNFYTAFTTGTTAATDLAEAFSGDISIAESLGAICGYVSGEITALAGDIQNALSPVLTDLKGHLENAVTSVETFGNSLRTSMSNAYSGASGGLKGIFAAAFEGVADIVATVVGAIMRLIDEDFDPATSKFVQNFVKMHDAVQDFIANFSLGGVVEKIKQFVLDAGTAFSNFINLFKSSNDDISDGIETQVSGLDYYRAQLYDGNDSFLGKLLDILSQAAKIIRTLSFSKLLDSLGNLNNAISKVTNGSLVNDLVKKLNEFKKVSLKSVIGVALSLTLLAVAVNKLAQLDMNDVGVAVAAIGALGGILYKVSTGLTGMNLNGKGNKNLISMGAMLLEISLSMVIMASAIKMLVKAAESEDVYVAMSLFAGIIGSLMLLMITLKACEGGLTGSSNVGIMFLKIASGMVILVKAITALSDALSVEGNHVLEALNLMGFIMIALVLVIGMIAIIQKGIGETNMAGIGAFFVAAAASMLIMTAAVGILAMIPSDALSKAVSNLAAIILIVGLYMILGKIIGGNTAVKMASALLITAVAIGVFAVALTALGLIPTDIIATAMDRMILILGSLAVILMIVAPAIATAAPGLLALAAVILAVAVAIGIISAALIAFAFAMQILETIQDIGGIIKGLCAAIIMSAPEIQAAIVAFVGATCAALVESADVLADTLVALIKIIWEVIVELFKTLFPKIYDLGKTLWTNLLDGIKSVFSNLIDAVTGFYNKIIDTAKSIFDINSPSGVFSDIGINLILGFINGVKSKIESAIDTIKGFGSRVVSGLKNILGINSPSTVFAEIGKYCDLGFAEGLTDYSSISEAAASSVGEGALDSITSSLSDIGNIDLDSLGASATITPVLDLSEIQNGSTDISSLLDSSAINGTVSSVSTMQVDTTSASIDALTAALNQLKDDFNAWKEADTSLASELPAQMVAALAETGVYMDTNKVGKLVTRYQANVARMTKHNL